MICPISPAVPVAPIIILPSFTIADPTPVPTNMHTKSLQSFPAPNFCSPIVAISTSFPTYTGISNFSVKIFF